MSLDFPSIFNANAAPDDPRSYQALEMRRKIALAMLGRDRKGYPKNIGEGLSAIGDALAERAAMSAMMGQQAAFDKYNAAHPPPNAASLIDQPVGAARAAPGPAAAAEPDEDTSSSATAAAVPDAAPASADGVFPAVPGTPTAAAGGDFSAPAYLKTAIANNEPDPAMRQYLGSMAAKEAKSPNEVSSTGAAGPFQFLRSTGKQYGLNGDGFDNRADPEASTKAMQAFTKDNIKTLTDGLGRPPTYRELALAHQQGAETAVNMLTGSGNASARNLSVNNVPAGASPQAAANKIMGYYNQPNTPVGAPAQTAQAAPPPALPAPSMAFATQDPSMAGQQPGPSAPLMPPGGVQQAMIIDAMRARAAGPTGGPAAAPAAPRPFPAPLPTNAPGGFGNRFGGAFPNAAPSPPPGPGPQSDAGPLDDAQSSQLASLMGPPGGPPRPPSGPPTASLGSSITGQVNDADPIGQTRNAITQQLLMGQNGPQPAGAVPQVNPMQSAAPPPPSSSRWDTTALTSPPEAAANRPITMRDMQPMPAGPVPAPGAQMAQAATAPNIPEINRVTPPVTMPPPGRVPAQPEPAPHNQAEIAGMNLYQQGVQEQNPVKIDQGKFLLQQGTAERTKQDADNKAAWEAEKNLERERTMAQEAAQRGKGVAQQQLLEAQAKAAEAQRTNRFGGGAAYQQFVGDLSKDYAATQQLSNAMPTLRQAKQALAQSYTGTGAGLKLDANKMLRTLGVPGDYTPEVATEMLGSRMKAIAGGLIKSTVGSQNISDADRDFVEAAYSGKISMEPESLRRLLGIAEDTTIRSINRHNDRLIGVTKNADDSMLRDQYQVPMQYGDEAVSYLKAHPETADLFDKKFGRGHAKAVLQGVPYGQ